jgi:hypothetical protein
VASGKIPTLKMEAKKRKGLDLLRLVCKCVSEKKVSYIIDFLQKYLNEHLLSEDNIGKYDQMLGAISSGLATNSKVLDPSNAGLLLASLAGPVSKLKENMRWIKESDTLGPENTIKKGWDKHKAGKEEILTLQAEAGRNGSIFRRMGK